MDSDIPSISSGAVGSRFVSQTDIETARARRDEQWKAAYARLGQEPPPQPKEEVYDGRSLAEKLAANKVAKQEEWEERNRLANQFRALEEDEVLFLDSVRERQIEEERQREQADKEEVSSFKAAVAARDSAVTKPVLASSPPAPATSTKPSKPAVPAPVAKKNALKGVLVKKKASTSAKAAPSKPDGGKKAPETAPKDETTQPPSKKRKVD